MSVLTHWGHMTHICAKKLTIIGSDNGLSPGLHQAIIWTSAVILLIRPLGTNFSEILIEIYAFSFNRMYRKMFSGKWRQFCIGLSVLITLSQNIEAWRCIYASKTGSSWLRLFLVATAQCAFDQFVIVIQIYNKKHPWMPNLRHCLVWGAWKSLVKHDPVIRMRSNQMQKKYARYVEFIMPVMLTFNKSHQRPFTGMPIGCDVIKSWMW